MEILRQLGQSVVAIRKLRNSCWMRPQLPGGSIIGSDWSFFLDWSYLCTYQQQKSSDNSSIFLFLIHRMFIGSIVYKAVQSRFFIIKFIEN